jgi:hypothetical protein
VTEEMVLRFAAIISSRVEHGCGWVDAATEALRAVAPLIAARQTERDAKKAELFALGLQGDSDEQFSDAVWVCREIAAAIRGETT